MRILLIDNKSARIQGLEELILNYGAELNVKGAGEFTYDDIEYTDSIILSGSSSIPVLNDEGFYAQERILIKESDKPIIGICLGFELIAHTLGAKLKRRENKVHGVVTLSVLDSECIIFSHLSQFSVFESHRWVVESLPDKLIPLAVSEFGVEAFKHKERSIYGFQFHPSAFPNTTAGAQIFYNLFDFLNRENN